MNRKALVSTLVLLTLLLATLVGCTSARGVALADRVELPPLSVIGDVAEPLTIRNLAEFTPETVTYQDKEFTAIALAEIISRSQPSSDEYTVQLVGNDGLTAQLDDLDEAYITYTNTHGWQAINPLHPVSSNIKLIKEIIVTTNSFSWEGGVNIITRSENLQRATVGQLLAGSYQVFNKLDGKATLNKEGKERSSASYAKKRVVSLADMLKLNQAFTTAALMGYEGEIVTAPEVLLELKENKVNVLDNEGSILMRDLVGIILDPPKNSITDVYSDTVDALTAGERAMVIVLDGFSYQQYLHTQQQNMIPFLEDQAQPALSVYKPVTNAGLAAILTGTTPSENGVHDRSVRQLNSDTIFKVAQDLDKSAAFVEGNIQILDTETRPILNLDSNEDGYTDDEVLASALLVKEEQVDLLVVHFHGIDDYGHSYGPLHDNTLARIALLDEYVQQLANEWPGRIIITADHGMHQKEDSGDHGLVRFEDLIVPYIVIEGDGAR